MGLLSITRLVLFLGALQEYDINYNETFALATKMTYVWVLIVLVATRVWPLYQLDVKNTFSQSDLQEEVYIKPPLGLAHLPQHVCHLHHAIYGLKQVSRAWFEKFNCVVLFLASLFIPSVHNYAMFIHLSPCGHTILLYVDGRWLGTYSIY